MLIFVFCVAFCLISCTRDKPMCLSHRPAFLPDPNDGSLYSLGGKNNEGLTVGGREHYLCSALKTCSSVKVGSVSDFPVVISALVPEQKLPFTIPELVQASPCRSSDGVLYMGKAASQTGVAPFESNSQHPGVLT